MPDPITSMGMIKYLEFSKKFNTPKSPSAKKITSASAAPIAVANPLLKP